MPTIISLQVFYRLKPEHGGEVHSIEQAPSDQSTEAIKIDVRRIVERIKAMDTAEYYYMVVKVRKSDGSFGYRTMIPKTLLA